MSDETPTSRPRKRQDEVIEDAVVVDDAAATNVSATADAAVPVTDTAASPAVPETPTPSPAEPDAPVDQPTTPVAAPAATPADSPAAATVTAPAEAAPRVVYVEAPVPPKPLGNRGVGVLFALLGTVIFTVALAVATFAIQFFGSGLTSVDFLTNLQFYIPVLVFLVAFVVLVLIANRAAWWAYIIGSLIVALVVYFGAAALGLLLTGVVQNTPAEAIERWNATLGEPFVIIAAVLAREVAMWMGVAIARRGRRIKARNVQRRADWQRELDEKRAEREHAAYPAAPAQ